MTQKKVHLAGTVLDRSRHVCAFFHSKEEEYQVLLPFVVEGFEHGDRAFHVVNPQLREQHRQRLQQAGVEVEETERRGQLEIRRWEDAYLQDGHFDQHRMLQLIEEVLSGGREQGYPPHPAGGQHGVGAGGPPRRRRHRGVRDPAELRAPQVRRCSLLNVRSGPVRCQRGHGHPADPPHGDCGGNPAREPVLRPTGRDAAGAE